MAPDRNGERPTNGVERTASERAAAAGTGHTARPPIDLRPRLELATVAYQDQPDRCTLFPAAYDGPTLLTTWLSADRDALCSLAAWR